MLFLTLGATLPSARCGAMRLPATPGCRRRLSLRAAPRRMRRHFLSSAAIQTLSRRPRVSLRHEAKGQRRKPPPAERLQPHDG